MRTMQTSQVESTECCILISARGLHAQMRTQIDPENNYQLRIVVKANRLN